MFTIGTKVVHPLHGLGTVDSIEEKAILGQISKYACISFSGDRLRIMVNLRQKNSMIRPLINSDEISKVMDHLRDSDGTLPTRSSDRYSLNIKKIKSCDIYQLAEVIRDLTGLSQNHKLSPKEQQMLKSARKTLAVEFSYVNGKNEEEMEAEIDETCRHESSDAEILVAVN